MQVKDEVKLLEGCVFISPSTPSWCVKWKARIIGSAYDS
jgi:hypothetical protein